MTRTPLVTVVTATHNRLALLRETVNSVQQQDDAAWEMIIVDDASADGTSEWVQALDDARVRGFRFDEHAERSAARNLGLREARGEWVLFLDDDDLLPPDALSTHLGRLASAPQAVASVGARVLFTAEGEEVLDRVVGRVVVRDAWQDVLFGWVSVAGATLFNAETLRSLGGWDPSYVIAEDYELWTRVARQGPVVVCPDVVLRYRVHGGQWRSPDFMGLMDEIRRSAVETVPASDRARGEAALAAREAFREAERLAMEGRNARALVALLRGRRAAPGLVGSPLLVAVPDARPLSLPRAMVKAAVPGVLMRALKRRRSASPDSGSSPFKARVREDHDGRFRPARGSETGGRPAVSRTEQGS